MLAGVQRWLARAGDVFWELGQLGIEGLSLVTLGREEHGCIGFADQRTPYAERALQLRGPGHNSTTVRLASESCERAVAEDGSSAQRLGQLTEPSPLG